MNDDALTSVTDVFRVVSEGADLEDEEDDAHAWTEVYDSKADESWMLNSHTGSVSRS